MPASSSSGTYSDTSNSVAVSDCTIHAQIVGYVPKKKDAASYTLFISEIINFFDGHPELKSDLEKLWHGGLTIEDYVSKAKDPKELYEGIKQVLTASRYKGADNALVRGNYGGVGVGMALGVLIDIFQPIANHYHLQLNEVGLCLAKVALDIGTASTTLTVAGVMADAGLAFAAASGALEVFLALLPVLLLIVAVIDTARDSYHFVKAIQG